jgi:hypothetical protein
MQAIRRKLAAITTSALERNVERCAGLGADVVDVGAGLQPNKYKMAALVDLESGEIDHSEACDREDVLNTRRLFVEACSCGAVLDSELRINALEVFAHSAWRNAEDFADLGIRFSGRQPMQDIVLAGGQLPMAPLKFSTAFLDPLQE